MLGRTVKIHGGVLDHVSATNETLWLWSVKVRYHKSTVALVGEVRKQIITLALVY